MNNSYKNIDIKIPIIIPIVVLILLFCILSIKIYVSNSFNDINPVHKPNTEIVDTIEEEEIKEELIEEVDEKVIEETETVTYTHTDGKQYNVIATLEIPSLGIKYPILDKTTDELLKISTTKYWGANPNEVGNMVVLGHNYKNNKFFGNLSKIQHGEIVKITDLAGKTLDYKVYDTYVIDPYDNSCTSQLTDGKTEITLITCYYENGSNHATKRFVVKARAD